MRAPLRLKAPRRVAAIQAILQHEGGYVNHPADPGGATNMGVTLDTFRRYVKPGGTIDDLKALTVEQAAHVFRRHYWDKVSADELPAGVDYAVADFAVNSGPTRAAKFLQRIVRVPADGIIGPQTIAATWGKPSEFIINRLCDDRLAFLKSLDTWPTFGRGWSARVEDVRRVALKWADPEEDPPCDYAHCLPEKQHLPSLWQRIIGVFE